MKKSFWHQLPKPILALAPMAGYTDSAFRQICREMGADVVYSEMISVDALCFNNQKTLNMLRANKKESPVVFQLFGNDPQKFAQATKIITQSPISDHQSLIMGLDINFGCPAHKVTKTGSGASLMNDTDKAYDIIKAVCDNTNLPISIKIRAQNKNIDAIQFINRVKNLPWQAIMIHGRTLSQGFGGKINYNIIKKVKQLVPDKIILANGGITDSESAIKTLKLTQADGLGIARGALGNPWVFQKKFILKRLKATKDPMNNKPAWPQRKKIILKHAQLFLEYSDNLEPLRKHLVHYVRGQKNASQLRQKLIQVRTLAEIKKIL